MTPDKLSPNPKCETCRHYDKILDQYCEIEEQLRCALKITHLGIWEWNLITGKISLSDEIYEIIGLVPDQFDGSLSYIADYVIHPDHRDFFLDAVKMDITNKEIQIREYRINLPNAKNCWVRLNGVILYDETNTPYKILGTLLDITNDYLNNAVLRNDLAFLEALMEALPNPIFYKDALGLYRFCNVAFLNYLGLSRDQIINKSVYDVSPPELASIYKQADLDLMHSKKSQVYEANVKYADGTVHDVIFSKGVHLDDAQNVLGIVGIMQDITEKKAIEHQIIMLHKIKDVFLEINHLIMTFNSERDLLQALLQKIQGIFPACTESSVLELGEDNYLTILASNGFRSDERENFKLHLEESFMWIDLKGCFTEAHIVNDVVNYSTQVLTPASGKVIESTLIVPIEINGSLKWFFALDSDKNKVFTDIDRKAADFIREELPLVYRIYELYQITLQLSRYDSLTGLMNRSYFDTILDDRLSTATRNNESLLLVLFDLDGLKTINDRFGHHAGDLYLTTFSDLLKSTYRHSDSFSRIGGDEFIGLFSAAALDNLTLKIDAMGETFKNMDISTGTHSFRGSFSYGIAVYPQESSDKNKLMQIADQKMYAYKLKNSKTVAE